MNLNLDFNFALKINGIELSINDASLVTGLLSQAFGILNNARITQAAKEEAFAKLKQIEDIGNNQRLEHEEISFGFGKKLYDPKLMGHDKLNPNSKIPVEIQAHYLKEEEHNKQCRNALTKAVMAAELGNAMDKAPNSIDSIAFDLISSSDSPTPHLAKSGFVVIRQSHTNGRPLMVLIDKTRGTVKNNLEPVTVYRYNYSTGQEFMNKDFWHSLTREQKREFEKLGPIPVNPNLMRCSECGYLTDYRQGYHYDPGQPSAFYNILSIRFLCPKCANLVRETHRINHPYDMVNRFRRTVDTFRVIDKDTKEERDVAVDNMRVSNHTYMSDEYKKEVVDKLAPDKDKEVNIE